MAKIKPESPLPTFLGGHGGVMIFVFSLCAGAFVAVKTGVIPWLWLLRILSGNSMWIVNPWI